MDGRTKRTLIKFDLDEVPGMVVRVFLLLDKNKPLHK